MVSKNVESSAQQASFRYSFSQGFGDIKISFQKVINILESRRHIFLPQSLSLREVLTTSAICPVQVTKYFRFLPLPEALTLRSKLYLSHACSWLDWQTIWKDRKNTAAISCSPHQGNNYSSGAGMLEKARPWCLSSDTEWAYSGHWSITTPHNWERTILDDPRCMFKIQVIR